MYVSLEHFEESIAVLCDDDGLTLTVEREHLPTEAKVGDILRLQDGRYVLDQDETAKRRSRIWQMEQLLRNKNKK